MRRDLAMNPHLQQDVLGRLLEDPEVVVRGALASNPQIGHEAQARLAGDRSAPVRAVLARENPALLRSVQTRLSLDPDALVVKALVSNPHLEPRAHLALAALAQTPAGRGLVKAALEGFDAESRAAFEPGWSGTLAELVEVLTELR
jgi:hypothetical protein